MVWYPWPWFNVDFLIPPPSTPSTTLFPFSPWTLKIFQVVEMETWARSSWLTKWLRVVLAVSCTLRKRLPLSFLICQSLCLAHTVPLVCLEFLPSSSYLLHCLVVLPVSCDVVLCSSIYNILCHSIICYIMSWLFILDLTLQGQSSVFIHLYGFSTGKTLSKCWTGWNHSCSGWHQPWEQDRTVIGKVV